MPPARLELSDLPPYAREQAERQLRDGRARAAAAPPAVRPTVKADAPKSELEEAFLTLRRQLAPWLPEPVRDYHFAAEASEVTRPRRWALDFAWVAERVAVEVEGGAGRAAAKAGKRLHHVSPEGYASDCWKYSTAAALGWAVLRCTGAMLAKDPDGFLKLVAYTVARRRSGSAVTGR